ncbi:DUF429 domain-containing protein [Lapillicoccus jejuensis]|uniref:Uncharacterized protein DUF429 n=1 Tax=Lapillicoccus jejuensis TaxID=402171 RepID=A0A542DZB1_9MICO|nr:uncharacterized protein DUF429 [Lapillicoccus jejuensis]
MSVGLAFASPIDSRSTRVQRASQWPAFAHVALHDVCMETIGIDMAADPKNTAAAQLLWLDGGVRVIEVCSRTGDEELAAWLDRDVDKIGVDCPLGWPDAFVDFVVAHREQQLRRPEVEPEKWRRTLTLRETDMEIVKAQLGTPLSVSADRIAHPTLRLASVLSRRRPAVRRDGSDVVVEVYPAAALKKWQLPGTGYKGPKAVDARRHIVNGLNDALSLDWGGHEDIAVTSDHVMDAVICALVARAAATGRTTRPESLQKEQALREGWIHVPTSEDLSTLSADA